MTVECIDGRAGRPHIDGADKGRLHAGLAGVESVVLPVGNKFAARLDGQNRITIATGDCLIHGRHCAITAPEQVTIQSGTQGQKRNDLICIRYVRDGGGTDATESAEIAVLKGSPSYSSPNDPTVPNGNVLAGSNSDYFPLYRVRLDGVNAKEPEQLFQVLTPASSIRPVLDSAKREIEETSSQASRELNNKIEQAEASFDSKIDRVETSLKAKVLHSSSRWVVFMHGGAITATCLGDYLDSGAWASKACPYTVPYHLRPKNDILAPAVTKSGASWTGFIAVRKDGSISVGNLGNSGSTDYRHGQVTWLPGM